MEKIVLFLFLAAIGSGVVSCNNTKYLPANETLYTGAKIKIESTQLTKKKKKTLNSELNDLTRPIPNKTILGLRPKLWFWNIGGTPKKKFSVKRLIKNMGEPPVLASDVDLEKNNLILQSFLENKGFFRSTVSGDTVIKAKRATAVYSVNPNPQYTIKQVIFQKDTSEEIIAAINQFKRRTYLVKGKPFDLDMIKGERDRIDARLKQRGYYYFSPDDILIDVDSTIGNHEVDLYVNLKPQTPKRARNHYRINEVVVYPTFSLTESGDDTTRKYAEKYRDYVVIDSSKMYKPKLFQQAMQFSPGDLYNRTEHNATLNRLINLGIFKFVKNRFEPVKNSDSLLNAYYYLTPLPKKSLRLELGGTTKSNNLTGSELTVGFTNRNAFRGGEILSVNVSGGFEVQYSGQYKGYNTYRLGAEGNLTIPRFVVPLVYVNPRGGFVPRTNIQLGYEVLTKQKLYTLNSLRAGYGYIWKETAKKEHTFYPISVQYVQPVNITDQYKASVIDNPTLAKVVDTQFILGATYNYLYTDVERRGSDNGFYFNGLLDISGNIAGLVKRNVIKGGDTARLFGAPFSQYLKTEFDFRYYRKLSQKNSWANRIILGVGFPYGNSKELPFIKQFFVGGNNSLRAFRSRSLGPGIYKGFGDDGFFPDQSGDIKLEINSELRFNIAGPVYGAMFVDAGNIWLYRENTYKPGAKFSSSFLKELAAGTGLGLRIDISILVLRLDVAFPIRKPWLPESERWVINDIKFGSSSWRKENLIFNLGIGYPF